MLPSQSLDAFTGRRLRCQGSGGRSRRWSWYGLLALLGVLFGAGATLPPAPEASHPMDTPLRVIAEARQSYQQVVDYSCTFVKRERLNDQLQPENVIEMKVKARPFSVYLRWLAPRQSVGQEACYVEGQNNGMMRVHSTGLLGVAGFVSLAPNDPRALRNSKHPITDAGIGNLIERFAGRWDVERRLNKTQVRVADYEYAKRPCTRVETIHPDNSGREFLTYRSVLYFDKQTHLPVRVEAYDWPHRGGDPNGDLMESYSYVNLQFNTGLRDDDFRH
jgi:hypothetical protein